MDKVRVGLIGCGGFARYRLGNLLSIQEAEVAALADPSEDQLKRTKTAHPKVADIPTYSDYKEMLAKEKLDAVAIATPHTQHVQQVLDGLAASLHVICEKPLVTTVEDAHRVIAARDRAGKIGMVSYQRHMQPEFRMIREKIQSGEAGPVHFVSAVLSQEWKRATAGSWRQDPALSGGGQLNDSGSHLVDILLWSTGLHAETVTAIGDQRGTQVDINSAVNIKYKEGAIGSIAIIGDGHNWHEDVTIWCDNLSFFMREGKLTIVDKKGNKFKAEHLVGGGNTDRNFVETILGKAECEAPFECGLPVIALTQAAWDSMAKGGTPAAVSN
jgi:predicted dehydrogenase